MKFTKMMLAAIIFAATISTTLGIIAKNSW